MSDDRMKHHLHALGAIEEERGSPFPKNDRIFVSEVDKAFGGLKLVDRPRNSSANQIKYHLANMPSTPRLFPQRASSSFFPTVNLNESSRKPLQTQSSVYPTNSTVMLSPVKNSKHRRESRSLSITQPPPSGGLRSFSVSRVNRSPVRMTSSQFGNGEAVGVGYSVSPSKPAPILSVKKNEEEEFDPQSEYPASACIFVANLSEPATDEELDAALTREFSKYGTVFVKVRRNASNMPYAFCQFTTDAEARLALEKGRGAVILGRSCRTEPVKANIEFLLYRRDKANIDYREARNLLQQFGQLQHMNYLTQEEMDMRDLDCAALRVCFSHFDHQREILSAFKNNLTYAMENFDTKKARAGQTYTSDRDFMEVYDAIRRSIYVGNLPLDITEEQVASIFVDICKVLSVDIRARDTNCFAFVEFSHPTACEKAIDFFNGQYFGSKKVTVQRRKAKVTQVHTPTPKRAASTTFEKWGMMKESLTPRTHEQPKMKRSVQPVEHANEERTPVSIPRNNIGVGATESKAECMGQFGNEAMYGFPTYPPGVAMPSTPGGPMMMTPHHHFIPGMYPPRPEGGWFGGRHSSYNGIPPPGFEFAWPMPPTPQFSSPCPPGFTPRAGQDNTAAQEGDCPGSDSNNA